MTCRVSRWEKSTVRNSFALNALVFLPRPYVLQRISTCAAESRIFALSNKETRCCHFDPTTACSRLHWHTATALGTKTRSSPYYPGTRSRIIVASVLHGLDTCVPCNDEYVGIMWCVKTRSLITTIMIALKRI